jgi:hypothetical protein
MCSNSLGIIEINMNTLLAILIFISGFAALIAILALLIWVAMKL